MKCAPLILPPRAKKHHGNQEYHKYHEDKDQKITGTLYFLARGTRGTLATCDTLINGKPPQKEGSFPFKRRAELVPPYLDGPGLTLPKIGKSGSGVFTHDVTPGNGIQSPLSYIGSKVVDGLLHSGILKGHCLAVKIVGPCGLFGNV